MKAMIFAAGLGTRLRPLTNDKPKALVKVHGIPLLEIIIRRLIGFGFEEIIVNVHHFAYLVEDFLNRKKHFGIHIEISDESALLLETGGGIKHASWFFDDGKPFLVHNVDILSNIDLKKFYDYHCQNKAIATLASRVRKTSRYLLYDRENRLCGWKNVKNGEVRMSREIVHPIPLAFSGMHIIEPAIFPFIHQEGAFSIIDVYLHLAREHLIQAYPHTNDLWLDVGKPENIKKAEEVYTKQQLFELRR